MIKQCVVCKKDFECQRSSAKYCSKYCENEARKLRILHKQEMKNTYKTCLICNNKFQPKTPAANQRLCCYNCMPEGEQYSRSDFLNLIKKLRGGKCEHCEYDKYLGALDFHHRDPSKKDFTIGDKKYKLKDCIEETKKCILICSNCHRELHAKLWDIKDIEKGEVGFDTN